MGGIRNVGSGESAGRIVLNSQPARALRNKLCPLPSGDLKLRESTASHLRGAGVAQLLGTTAVYKKHPSLTAKPLVSRTPTRVQAYTGSELNPARHSLPCGIALNERPHGDYLVSAKAQDYVNSIVGRVIALPDDDPSVVRLFNDAERSLENYRAKDGLAAALELAVICVVDCVEWKGPNGTGLASAEIAEITEHAYKGVWLVHAEHAFYASMERTGKKLSRADSKGRTEDVAKYDLQLQAMDAQLNKMLLTMPEFGYFADLTLKNLSGEPWAGTL